ncbi:MAG TPA: hypothetical protein VNJ01_17925 [Bacteriovoracaceae bacterium]|nr:hypothetical protein [Bacteriovoracaceae bacterium]
MKLSILCLSLTGLILWSGSSKAEEQTLKGTFGSSCVETFRGLQCHQILELAYDWQTVSLKSYNMDGRQSVANYSGRNPNHEIYWIKQDKHLILTKKFRTQPQQQQQQPNQTQQQPQSQYPQQQTHSQQQEFQVQVQQQQPSHGGQYQQTPVSELECQTVTEIYLREGFGDVIYEEKSFCSDGSQPKSSNYGQLVRIP